MAGGDLPLQKLTSRPAQLLHPQKLQPNKSKNLSGVYVDIIQLVIL